MECKIFDSLRHTGYPLRVVLENENTTFNYTIDGRYSIYSESDLDLINVPEPTQNPFWACPDDVPTDKIIWITNTYWTERIREMIVFVNSEGIRTRNTFIPYAEIGCIRWLDNGEWKECRRE